MNVQTKVLNLVGYGCSGFSMERDALLSHPVLTLRTENVPRYPDLDTKMLAGCHVGMVPIPVSRRTSRWDLNP